MELANATIAITGGGRGLGAAMAKRLAGQGCRLALIDLDEDSLAETRKACEDAGAPLVRDYTVNVTDEAVVEGLFASIGSEF